MDIAVCGMLAERTQDARAIRRPIKRAIQRVHVHSRKDLFIRAVGIADDYMAEALALVGSNENNVVSIRRFVSPAVHMTQYLL